jgi:hypothetical protein
MIWFYPDNIESGGKYGLSSIKIRNSPSELHDFFYVFAFLIGHLRNMNSKTKVKTGNMVYKYFSVKSYHSERLLRGSILRNPTFSSAFNIVWMEPYHRTRLRQPVLCIL